MKERNTVPVVESADCDTAYEELGSFFVDVLWTTERVNDFDTPV